MAIIKGTIDDDSGDFALEGTSSRDTIYGYQGNDELFGLGGDDVLKGGSGDDDLWGGSGVNNLYGDDPNGPKGEDWFRMSERGSKLSDDYIADFQFGYDRIDVSKWGVSDFSQIKALLQSDADGNAVFNARFAGYNHFLTIGDVSQSELQSSDFVFSTRSAKDNIYGTSSSDTLFGTLYDDLIKGNGGSDKLLGGKGYDHIYGGSGNDYIYGGSGNDRIYGGQGADVMNGGSGADRFVFTSASETHADGHIDYITDFTLGSDRIDVSAVDAVSNSRGVQSFEWIGDSDFYAAGQLSFTWSGDDTIVSGNTDHDTAAEFQIALKGHLDLIADDFIL